MGFAGTSLKASASNSASTTMSTGMGAGSATTDYMAYQYKYDTIHGIAKGTVEIDGDFLVLNGKKIQTSRCRDPKEVGWGPLNADYVCESPGVFLPKETAQSILDGGAKKVIY